jgi:glutamate-5-semialdehyde dehydrogenase
MDAHAQIKTVATAARDAWARLVSTTGQQRNDALRRSAAALRTRCDAILVANAKDIDASASMDLSEAMVRRLRLDEAKVEAMAVALEEIAAQVDPVGQTICASNRPNGLRVEKRRVPIGVVGIIFESRPNVTSDAAGLCLKSGNACILRGGKEAIHSNLAIAEALREGLRQAQLPAEAVTVLEQTDRALVPAMATARGLIDLIIPRGGRGLIHAVTEAATIPVIKHYDGICHVYIHAAAEETMARRIALNAKCQYPAVCNAMETLLIDDALEETLLPGLAEEFFAAGVELRGCRKACQVVPRMTPASSDDWATEYLDLILSVRVVDGIDQAIEHINTFGSGHTDAIVTSQIAAAEQFTAEVDSASVMVNASTRWADGGRYGLGAEIGISTDKLHARGPMGAEDLTTYKWVVRGDGHIVE